MFRQDLSGTWINLYQVVQIQIKRIKRNEFDEEIHAVKVTMINGMEHYMHTGSKESCTAFVAESELTK